MIPVSHLPWHPTRADIVPLRFLPNEAVVSDYQRAAARANAPRVVRKEDYQIGEPR